MKPIVFVEGGGSPNDMQLPPTPAPAGIEDLIPNGPIGTQKQLQDAFYALFEKAVTDIRVHFEISPVGGWEQTVKQFASQKQEFPEADSYLMIDYREVSGNNRQAKYVTLQGVVEDKIQALNLPALNFQFADEGDRIFFMVQTMEAWILSQPHILDQEFIDAKKDTQRIESRVTAHRRMAPHEIPNPSYELKILLGYYEEERKGKWKKISYGKIKSAVRLLPLLDIDQLQRDFDDVRRFVDLLKVLSVFFILSRS